MSRKLLLLLALLIVAACSGDDSPVEIPPDPDPEFDIDVVRFRVWTLESGGEKLRWVGTSAGPLPDSPEATQRPWVGYGRAFRVEWKAFSEDQPIGSIRYRVSQNDFGPWFEEARDQGSFEFQNRLAAADLVGQVCPEGPDCVGELRLDSGRYRIEVEATTRDGRPLDASLGLLEFEVNYPPSLEIVFDPATGPDDPDASPVAWWRRGDGSLERVALAAGDTVPSGAVVRFRLRGQDRFAATTDTDSFCCDTQLDPGPVNLSFHGRTEFSLEDSDAGLDTFFTIFGPSSLDSVLSMDVGPFGYRAIARALDEHGRRGEEISFPFVAGFPPVPPTCAIEDGATALLNPARAAGPGEMPFAVSASLVLGWDPDVDEWYDDAELALRLAGRWYELPLSFRGDADPRARDVSVMPPPEASNASSGYSDHVRSFAYVLVHEDDPDNGRAEGAGDRDDLYIPVDDLGELDLTGESAWRIFVPDLFFTNPELFDLEGSCTGEFCDMSRRLLEQLGWYALRYRSHTTQVGSYFHQRSPQAGRDLVIDLRGHGRFSEWVEAECAVRIAFTDGSGQITSVWPADPR